MYYYLPTQLGYKHVVLLSKEKHYIPSYLSYADYSDARYTVKLRYEDLLIGAM